MSNIIERLNKVREQEELPPLEVLDTGNEYTDGYTNENDLGTLAGAFGLGAGTMLNNTLVGGTGYGLANLGRLVEFLSPFSGEAISDEEKNALYKIGFGTDYINQTYPYQDSWVTSGAKSVLSAQNEIEDNLNEYRQDLLGDNPTMSARIAEGGGSSIGYMLAALAAGGSPLTAAIISGAGEALSEAGGQLGDAYREGMYDKGAIGAINKGFLANSALNIGLDYFTGPFGKLVGGIKNPVGRYAAGTASEILNEILQEPSQNVIEQAVKNSMKNGTGFLSELGESVKQWPEMFSQLAPEVAGSTLLTQGLLAPLGIKANINYNNAANNEELGVRSEELEKLKADQATLQEQIKNSTNSDEKAKLLIRLGNVNEAIKNFGKDAGTIRNEKLEMRNEGASVDPFGNATPSPAPAKNGEGLENTSTTVQDPKIQAQIQALEEERDRIQNTINQATVTPEYFNDPQKQAEINELIVRKDELDDQIRQLKNSEEVNSEGLGVRGEGLEAKNSVPVEDSQKSTSIKVKKGEEINLSEAFRRLNRQKQQQATENTVTTVTQETQIESKPRTEEELRQNIKQKIISVGQDEDLAEVASTAFIAGNKYFAKWTGEKLENLVDVDNLNFNYKNIIEDDNGNPTDIKGQTRFNELDAIITLSQYADRSTVLHEFGHVFMKKFQTLEQSGKLKGLAKQDFETLLKTYGIEASEIGNANSSNWVNGHEKFATDLERYFYTGEAPNAKLKRIFRQFKEWLRAIYKSVESIRYVGADGRAHNFELSPDVKKVFDNMFSGNEEQKNSEGLGVRKYKRQRATRKREL